MEDRVRNNVIEHDLDEYWIDCNETPCPKGVSLICFTRYGITQIGPWHEGVVAWMPKPGRPIFYKG